MNTKQYIKQFLQEPVVTSKGVAIKFDIDGFLIAFGDEFRERIATEQKLCNALQTDFTYAKFQNLVKQMDCKFNAINNKAAGIDLQRNIFASFFAQYVVKERANHFPVEHAAISEKRKQRQEKEQVKSN